MQMLETHTWMDAPVNELASPFAGEMVGQGDGGNKVEPRGDGLGGAGSARPQGEWEGHPGGLDRPGGSLVTQRTDSCCWFLSAGGIPHQHIYKEMNLAAVRESTEGTRVGQKETTCPGGRASTTSACVLRCS